MPRRAKLVDDTKGREVAFGNRYALFIGYLSMATRGLGFLVLTWTTVVLLAGFVSTLQRKDFWCLTFITLVQTAGFFNVLLTQKLSYIGQFFGAIMDVGYTVVTGNALHLKFSNLKDVAMVVGVVVCCILLCPLAAGYVFGLLISAGISVWRLSQRDYGSEADGLGNLKPSLDILYSLALLQGVVFYYRAIFGFVKGNVVNSIVEQGEFGDQSHTPVSDYLTETVTGCEKDTSFASGRNLITYAVDLMVSKSPDDYLSGARILDAFARRLQTVARQLQESMQRHILMKYLIASASSADILQKLLQTFGCRSIYDREMREHVARIVASIAEDISHGESATHLPSSTHWKNTVYSYHISDTYEHDWDIVARCLPPSNRDKKEDSGADILNAYKALVVQGFRILGKLARNNNCRVMLETPYLLSKIFAPVTSDLLHQVDHAAWSIIVEGSLQVMAHLTHAIGQTGTKFHSEISNYKEAIRTMERILKCVKCEVKMQRQATQILAKLHKDTFTSLVFRTTKDIPPRKAILSFIFVALP